MAGLGIPINARFEVADASSPTRARANAAAQAAENAGLALPARLADQLGQQLNR